MEQYGTIRFSILIQLIFSYLNFAYWILHTCNIFPKHNTRRSQTIYSTKHISTPIWNYLASNPMVHLLTIFDSFSQLFFFVLETSFLLPPSSLPPSSKPANIQPYYQNFSQILSARKSSSLPNRSAHNGSAKFYNKTNSFHFIPQTWSRHFL